MDTRSTDPLTEERRARPAERPVIRDGRPEHTPRTRDHRYMAPGPRRDLRTEVANASGLNILIGIWLIISPWVLNYGTGDAIWNAVASGGFVAILAVIRAAGAYWDTWLSYLNALVGVWVFISAFWLTDTTQAFWNTFSVGAAIFFLAMWSASASEERTAV